MLSDVKEIIAAGQKNPEKAFPEIKKLASDKNWEKREDAATALAEISKKESDAVLKEMKKWSEDKDENVRRTAIESLRYLARITPKPLLCILEKLNKDKSIYVKKAVAHILREISKNNPDIVYGLCKNWAGLKNKNTEWIIKDGMKKLAKEKQEDLKNLLGG